MGADSQTQRQVALESARRARLGVPAAAGGVLFLLSAIISYAVISKLPSVGVLEGLKAALRGEAHPAVSPEAAQVRFLSHHSFGLIAGSVIAAIALAALVLVLLVVIDATRFRRPETTPVSSFLVLVGGAMLAVVQIALEIVRSIHAHDFTAGHNFSELAVENALTKGTANVLLLSLSVLAPLLLCVGMIMAMVVATRAGLITRWLRGLGIAAAIVVLPVFSEIAYLQLIPAAFLVCMGFLFMGRLPSGDPPAWTAGEALPWPSQAELRAEQLERKDAKRGSDAGRRPSGREEAVDSGTDGSHEDGLAVAAPEPRQPAPGGSSKRRRRKRR